MSVSCFVYFSEDGNDVFLRNFGLSHNYTEITSQKTALCIKGDLLICGMNIVIGSKWLILGSSCLLPRCQVLSPGTLKDVNFVADRLCGLVVRVLGYRSGCPGSIPGTTRKKN
jgi:hypothetical protein